MPRSLGAVTLAAVAGLAFATLLFNLPAQAGGAIIVGAGSAGFGQDAVPYTWDLASAPATGLVSGGSIQYRTDGGNLGVRSNTDANNSVEAMFNIWENVASSNIEFNRAGQLNSTGAFTDGDVNTAAEFDAVDASCSSNAAVGQAQNPIVYDADGSLFTSLGFPSGVIGFAGPCTITTSSATPGRITAANAALNGKFRDGVQGNLELTDNEFDAVFIHEFGHFFGLDHSQINQNCLGSQGGCPDFSDDSFGLPTMFPFLISGLEESSGVHPARTLSTDDTAWVSRLYPDGSFNANFGFITGTIFYSDGTTHGQGFNVIARQVDNMGTPGVNESRRIAASVVSGYLFTSCAGNTVVPGNCGQGVSSFGSRNTTLVGFYSIPVPPGSYTVEIEGINGQFTGGSGVGPIADLGFQFPLPGPAEFFDTGESNSDNPSASSPVSVSANATTSNINIIMNGTAPGLDALEPNTSVGNAAPIGSGTTTNLSVSPFGNEDFYSFQANAGATVRVEITALRLFPSSFLDSVLEIVNGSNTRLNTCRALNSANAFNSSCLNDDLPGTLDSGIEFQPSSTGTFFIHILDFRGDGRPELFYSINVTGIQAQNNPVPSVSSLSQTSAPVGSGGFTLTVFGSGFVSGSTVQWNGGNRVTTFVNAGQLQAMILSSDLLNAGTALVTVFSPAPGGGTSNPVPFNVLSPVITGLVPDIIPATSPAFTLTVNGANFIPTSVVRWNCTNSSCNRTMNFQFVNSGQLKVTIPASDVAAVGAALVRVFNSSGTGGISSAFPFTINIRNPLPTITGLSPAGVVEDGPAFTLTVFGSNFVFNSRVQLDTSDRATTFINATRLQASIPVMDIATVGTKSITVLSPGPGGGISNTAGLPVQSAPNPAPNATSLMPNSIVAGTVRDTLMVQVNGTGSSFINGSVVQWNGMNRVTMFNNANQLTATIPASDLVAAGMASVSVFTPGPGGGTSNAQTFTINNPMPATSALSPSSTVAGDPGLTLTVIGSNFMPDSVVRWNGSNRVTTFIGSSQLRATIPASDLAGAGMAMVTVFTPAPPLPNGQTSNGQTFTINSSIVVSSSLGEGAAAPRAATSTGEAAAGANSAPARPQLVVAPAGAVGVAVTLEQPEALEPRTVPAGSAEFTLTVRGKEFLPGAVVHWNGKELPTKVVSPTELETVVPARLVAAAGSARVTVFYPESGVESKSKTFTISPR